MFERATSEITLFEAPFSKEDNFHFGNLEAVLAKCKSRAFSGCNPIAIEMKKTIRLPMAGDYQSELASSYNYCRIKHYEIYAEQQSISYWFVTAMRWGGVNVLVVDLELDTINTFVTSENLSLLMDKTSMIEREHEDRWRYGASRTTLIFDGTSKMLFDGVKSVDDVSEGFPTILKEKKSETPILDATFAKAQSDDLKTCPWAVFYGRKSASDTEFTLLLNPFSPDLTAYLAFGAEPTQFPIASAVDFNFTYTRATKIIEYPYCPWADIAVGVTNSNIFNFSLDGALLTPVNSTEEKDDIYIKVGQTGIKVPYSKLISKRTRRRLINSVDVPSVKTTASIDATSALECKRALKDSKLYHSDFYASRFAYDVFSFDMPFEKCTFNRTASVSVYFSASFSATATFSFTFEPHALSMRETDDYPYTLICRRNNELPLVSDAYLDYMRNGYNFDQQSKLLSVGSSLLRGGISAGVASIANPAIGAVSIASNLIGGITSLAQSEIQMAEKRASLATTAIGLSGNDDVDILRDATGDKLTLFEYGLPEHLETMLDDLFYYYGYKRGYQGVPDATSRAWFNFVQCSPKWKRGVSAQPRACYDALAMRFREGVTFLHYQSSLKDSEATDLVAGHNIDRTRENWEKGLIK